jgi:hypothetical protein
MGLVSNDSVPEAALTRCLRELPNYVVLRNEEDLFGNLRRGGDVDLLVADLGLAERTLIRHLGVPVRIIRSSYVSGYSYDWGHVDLLPTIEWRGACYLRTDAVLENRRVSASGRPVPRIAHEAQISWLTSLLFGGFFKERYAAEIRQAVEIDGRAFRQTLIEAAGKKLGRRLWQAAVDEHAEISTRWTWSLRLAVWWRAFFRSPVRTIRRFVAFVIGELKLRFQPQVPWVAILGPERSRKFSLAHEMVHRFGACPYGNVKALHWRSDLMAHPHSYETVTNPHARPGRRPTGSPWRILALAADWLVCYWAQWVHLRAKGYVLVFDLTYFDAVLDHTYAPDKSAPWLGRAFSRVLPKPDLVFVLNSEPDVPWRGGQDVPPSGVARQRHADGALTGRLPAGHVLDGSLPLSVVADDIQRVVRAWMLHRSAASLGAQAPVVTSSPTRTVGSNGAATLGEPR